MAGHVRPVHAAGQPTPSFNTAAPPLIQRATATRLASLSDLESIALDLPLYRVPESGYRVEPGISPRSTPPELSDALALRVPGVVRNPVQTNPFQEDLIYRGFVATPLFGAPIGLSAYLDGATPPPERSVFWLRRAAALLVRPALGEALSHFTTEAGRSVISKLLRLGCAQSIDGRRAAAEAKRTGI